MVPRPTLPIRAWRSYIGIGHRQGSARGRTRHIQRPSISKGPTTIVEIPEVPIPDWGPNAAFYLLLLAALIVGAAARRVPFLAALVRFVTWGVIAVLLVVLIGERGRFDPVLVWLSTVLEIGDQRITGNEVHIRMAPDGHFWARVSIGGVDRLMLVDSGATLTALSAGTASAAGLELRKRPFPVMLRTANGTIEARTATVETLRLGDISAHDLPVVVSPALGDTDVLGMNFLSRLKAWRVEGSTLILVPHDRDRGAQG